MKKQKPTQITTVKQEINKLLDAGMKDNHQIYTRVVEELDIPRPTVRRIARDLRIELMQKVNILSGEQISE